MAALKSVLTKEFMKDKMPLPHYGEMAEKYYREFCKPSYRSLAAKGPEHVYQYFEKLGMKAFNEQTEIERTVTEKPKGANFVIGERLDLPAGEKARYKANVAAIKIVKNLIAENRYATAEEQEALSYILREWRDTQQKQKEFLGDEYFDYDLVVAHYNGRPCDCKNIEKASTA